MKFANPRRLASLLFCLAAACLPSLAHAQSNAEEEAERRASVVANTSPNAAKVLFGQKTTPANLQARAIGSYAKGCLAGAKALPVDGQTWQVMRLNRNRKWGHPDLIAYLEDLARRVPSINGWSGLLIGDISQPRGGPMITGHASHQIGLDADIWLTPMPAGRLSQSQREEMSARNMARSDWMDVDPVAWTPNHTRLIRAAASDPRVGRIFVNPALKVAICRETEGNRSWLSKVRPMWGHNYHFHIRMACPAGDSGCGDQDPPPDGDGCGQQLTDWLALQHKAIFAPKKPPGTGKGKPKPKPAMTLDALPAECRQVLVAN